MKKFGLAINSMVIVVLTGIATVMLHELGHFIPAYLYGLEPELHHNFVFYVDQRVSAFAQGLIAASGPVVSLFIGTSCLLFSKRARHKGLVSLTTLWLGLHGLLTFFGYLFVAPFFTYGDTGKVFALLGLPFWSVLAISTFGVVSLVVLFRNQAKEFTFYGEGCMTPAMRANSLILFPTLALVASAVLHLPVPTPLSLIAPLLMPWSFMTIYGVFFDYEDTKPSVTLNRISWRLIIGLAVVVGIFRMLV